jgi:hypothetical protein
MAYPADYSKVGLSLAPIGAVRSVATADFSGEINCQAKSDHLDAVKLVDMLVLWCNGGRKVWGVLRTPSGAGVGRRRIA